ncbi:hypothetical protein BJ878DRAFT_322936 [Calycina marina]|uniref:Uncharacterized protein n=1 Tax=Calycina marina TaxID=1763456 RepID=A0A9P7YVB8_9HELO|nr:hypothetical protein BJ878DRAFT_322936 [Calycina marina]
MVIFGSMFITTNLLIQDGFDLSRYQFGQSLGVSSSHHQRPLVESQSTPSLRCSTAQRWVYHIAAIYGRIPYLTIFRDGEQIQSTTIEEASASIESDRIKAILHPESRPYSGSQDLRRTTITRPARLFLAGPIGFIVSIMLAGHSYTSAPKPCPSSTTNSASPDISPYSFFSLSQLASSLASSPEFTIDDCLYSAMAAGPHSPFPLRALTLPCYATIIGFIPIGFHQGIHMHTLRMSRQYVHHLHLLRARRFVLVNRKADVHECRPELSVGGIGGCRDCLLFDTGAI